MLQLSAVSLAVHVVFAESMMRTVPNLLSKQAWKIPFASGMLPKTRSAPRARKMRMNGTRTRALVITSPLSIRLEVRLHLRCSNSLRSRLALEIAGAFSKVFQPAATSRLVIE